MNFDFSDDQKMLKDQARKFLEDKCSYDDVRSILESDDSHHDGVWNGLCELGFAGAAIPEEFGGLGLGALELCVIAEELGRAAAPVPFSSSIYMFAEALKYVWGSGATKKPLGCRKSLPAKLSALWLRRKAHKRHRRARWKASFSGGKLSGRKLPVPDGETASVAVVLANTGGKRRTSFVSGAG